jgi:hypothetical protein
MWNACATMKLAYCCQVEEGRKVDTQLVITVGGCTTFTVISLHYNAMFPQELEPLTFFPLPDRCALVNTREAIDLSCTKFSPFYSSPSSFSIGSLFTSRDTDADSFSWADVVLVASLRNHWTNHYSLTAVRTFLFHPRNRPGHIPTAARSICGRHRRRTDLADCFFLSFFCREVYACDVQPSESQR